MNLLQDPSCCFIASFLMWVSVCSPQVQYISTAKEDGSDDRCEQLGWKRLQHYSPSSAAWQLLDHQAALAEYSTSVEIPLTDDLYFPRQPFASLLACCKVRVDHVDYLHGHEKTAYLNFLWQNEAVSLLNSLNFCTLTRSPQKEWKTLRNHRSESL